MTRLHELSPEHLTETLLATTGRRPGGALFTEPRLHPAIELQQRYDRATTEDKARLKAAVSEAAAEWRHRAHGFENLRFLAQAAAALRVRRAAPHFERHLQRAGLLQRSGEHGEAPDVAGDVTAARAGFAPGERIASLLERLFFTPGLRPELAGVLLQGLCRSRREQLARYLERYLRVQGALSPGHFADPIFLRLFVESLTPVALAGQWPELAAPLRAFLLESLGSLESSGSPDLYFAIEDGGATLHVEAGGQFELFELRSGSVGDRFDDLHAAFGRMALPSLILGPS